MYFIVMLLVIFLLFSSELGLGWVGSQGVMHFSFAGDYIKNGIIQSRVFLNVDVFTLGKHILFDKLDEFDPLRQHRTFCPWMCGDNGSQMLAGWKLMLSALLSHKENLSKGDAPQEENLNLEKSSLLDEVFVIYLSRFHFMS